MNVKPLLGLRSVRHKIFAVVLLTSLTALLVTGVSVALYDLRNYRVAWENDMRTQAELIGRASIAALQFNDARLARSNLALLSVRPVITAAALYNAKGSLYASYVRADLDPDRIPPLPGADGVRIDDGHITIFQRIMYNK
jgi:hypothetical protein